MFCIFASSSANTRRFWAKPYAQDKKRNRITNGGVDKQSFVVFISRQLDRANSYLNQSRKSVIKRCKVGGIGEEPIKELQYSLSVDDYSFGTNDSDRDICIMTSGDVDKLLQKVLEMTGTE